MSTLLYTNMPQIQFAFRNASFQPRDVATAVHEASHAIVAMALGYRVSELYSDFRRPVDGRYEGQCRWDDAAASDVETAIVTAAGWKSLDFLESGVRYTCGHHTDWPSGGDLSDLREALGPQDFTEGVVKVGKAAHDILKCHRHALDALAVALLICKRLSEAEIRAVVGPVLADHWQTNAQQSRPASSPARNRATAPAYRVGKATVETRNPIPGLRYSEPVGVPPMKVRH